MYVTFLAMAAILYSQLLHRIFDGEEGMARINDKPAAHAGLTHRVSTEEDFAVARMDQCSCKPIRGRLGGITGSDLLALYCSR